MSSITLLHPRLINSAFGASETESELVRFSLSYESSLNLRVDLLASSVTSSTGITAKLQHRTTGGAYEDLATSNSSVAIAADGTHSITLHIQRSGDQADMPLRKACRLVMTTGAGDAVTIDDVIVHI